MRFFVIIFTVCISLLFWLNRIRQEHVGGVFAPIKAWSKSVFEKGERQRRQCLTDTPEFKQALQRQTEMGIIRILREPEAATNSTLSTNTVVSVVPELVDEVKSWSNIPSHFNVSWF